MKQLLISIVIGLSLLVPYGDIPKYQEVTQTKSGYEDEMYYYEYINKEGDTFSIESETPLGRTIHIREIGDGAIEVH